MRIGVDLGGTKTEAMALGEGGRELARRRVATPRHDYDGDARAIAALVRGSRQRPGARGTVGVGMPGTISPATGLVKNANSTWLIGRPLDRDLASLLGRPVRLANDANCFALSEAVDGAAAGGRVVFGVIVGTGTGGGIVVERKVLTGPNAIAGEWGHNPLPWPRAGRVARPRLLLRQDGLRRDLPVRARALARDHRAGDGRGRRRAGDRGRAGRGDAAARAALARATRSGWPAPSPSSSTSSIPT